MVKVKRSLPPGGLSSTLVVFSCVASAFYGFYTYIHYNRYRRKLKRENEDIKLAIMPFLAAESDVQKTFFNKLVEEKEAELMKDVPNWELDRNVYKTRSYMDPMRVLGGFDTSLYDIVSSPWKW